MTLPIFALLLDDPFPNIPGLTALIFVVEFGGIAAGIAAAVTPLVLLRRAKGERALAFAWIVETVLISAVGPRTLSFASSVGIGLLFAAVVVHLRAARRPDGRRLVDIAFAMAAAVVGVVIWVTVAR